MKLLLIILLLLAALGGVVVWLAITPAKRKQRERDDRRKRFVVNESSERVALAPERTRPVSGISPEDPPVAQERSPQPPSSDGPLGHAEGERGRLVQTPEGERILSRPPFELRATLLSRHGTRYFNALARRVPSWVVVCPRVRLDSIVQARNPTRSPAIDSLDWATWRRRVRMRSVDYVLCDRRTFRPLLAILIERPLSSSDKRAVFEVAGGRDRIPDEVFHVAGLPMLRLTGDFRQDWTLIRPYVDQAILPSVSESAIDDAHVMDFASGEGVNADAFGLLSELDADAPSAEQRG